MPSLYLMGLFPDLGAQVGGRNEDLPCQGGSSHWAEEDEASGSTLERTPHAPPPPPKMCAPPRVGRGLAGGVGSWPPCAPLGPHHRLDRGAAGQTQPLVGGPLHIF